MLEKGTSMSTDKTPTRAKQPPEGVKPLRENKPAQSDSGTTAAPSPQRLAPGRPPLFGQ